MKRATTLFSLIVFFTLLAGCGTAKNLSGGAPMDIKEFSFQHTASEATDCYRFELNRSDGEVHLYAEELFYNGRIVDTAVDENLLARIGELAGTLGVADWDGFDKTAKRGSDGSSFTLNITLTDGSTISAHGSNRFPDNYSLLYAEVNALYVELMELYGTYAEGDELP